jgi:hypothetical protein
VTDCVAADVCSPDGDVCASDTCPLIRAGGFCTSDGESHIAAKCRVPNAHFSAWVNASRNAMPALRFAVMCLHASACYGFEQMHTCMNWCIVRHYKCDEHADKLHV